MLRIIQNSIFSLLLLAATVAIGSTASEAAVAPLRGSPKTSILDIGTNTTLPIYFVQIVSNGRISSGQLMPSPMATSRIKEHANWSPSPTGDVEKDKYGDSPVLMGLYDTRSNVQALLYRGAADAQMLNVDVSYATLPPATDVPSGDIGHQPRVRYIVGRSLCLPLSQTLAIKITRNGVEPYGAECKTVSFRRRAVQHRVSSSKEIGISTTPPVQVKSERPSGDFRSHQVTTQIE